MPAELRRGGRRNGQGRRARWRRHADTAGVLGDQEGRADRVQGGARRQRDVELEARPIPIIDALSAGRGARPADRLEPIARPSRRVRTSAPSPATSVATSAPLPTSACSVARAAAPCTSEDAHTLDELEAAGDVTRLMWPAASGPRHPGSPGRCDRPPSSSVTVDALNAEGPLADLAEGDHVALDTPKADSWPSTSAMHQAVRPVTVIPGGVRELHRHRNGSRDVPVHRPGRGRPRRLRRRPPRTPDSDRDSHLARARTLSCFSSCHVRPRSRSGRHARLPPRRSSSRWRTRSSVSSAAGSTMSSCCRSA